MATCLNCGNEITRKKRDKTGGPAYVHCSKRCVYAWYRKKRRETMPVEPARVCEQCGKSFVRVYGGPRRFCCGSCQVIFQHKNWRKPKEIPCVDCGSTVVVKSRKSQRCEVCRRKHRNATINACYRRRNPGSLAGTGSALPSHYLTNRRAVRDKQPRKSLVKSAMSVASGRCQVCSVVLHPAIRCLHHVDMDRENNSLCNLVYLCRNCHGYIHWEIRQRVRNGAVLNRDLCVEVCNSYCSRSKIAENNGELSQGL